MSTLSYLASPITEMWVYRALAIGAANTNHVLEDKFHMAVQRVRGDGLLRSSRAGPAELDGLLSLQVLQGILCSS